MDYWASHSPKLSSDATKELLAYMDSKTFRDNIKGTQVSSMAADRILEWVVLNIRATNLIHTFSAYFMEWIKANKYIPNVWELYKAGKINGSHTQNIAETKIMGFAPFKSGLDPTNSEAFNRPIYLSVNIWRCADGQPFYGDLNAVLRPDFRSRLMLAPVDSGGYVQTCNVHGKQDAKSSSNCSVWSREHYVMGTMSDFQHLMLLHQDFYKYNMAVLVRRLGGHQVADDWFYHHYYEALLMGAFHLPEHLHYMVANFVLFGDKTIQSFGASLSRPLCWSGDKDTLMVDAVVGHLGGYNITSADVAHMEKVFSKSTSWHSMLSSYQLSLQFRLLIAADVYNFGAKPRCVEVLDRFYFGVNGHGRCLFYGK